MVEEPLRIGAATRVKPACPRCGSVMILIGRFTDAMGNGVQFAAVDRDGYAQPMGTVKSCYCNDCGEISLTLE